MPSFYCITIYHRYVAADILQVGDRIHRYAAADTTSLTSASLADDSFHTPASFRQAAFLEPSGHIMDSMLSISTLCITDAMYVLLMHMHGRLDAECSAYLLRF